MHVAKKAACFPEQLCSNGLILDFGHFRLLMSMSYSHKILNASLEWSFDPLCDPHAKAIDFDSLLNFDEAPLLTKGIAWNT